MSARAEPRSLRIGEVADRAGVTTRTIRYYEELGLLGADDVRAKGATRRYSEADIVRLQELIRLRDLLGLSLDELVLLVEGEETRMALRDRWAHSASDSERGRIVDEAIALHERRLELVHARARSLDEFADELSEKLRSLHARRLELAERRVDTTG